ncbi:hypothetical protein ACQ4PT_061608 [Festuca glaucescens]
MSCTMRSHYNFSEIIWNFWGILRSKFEPSHVELEPFITEANRPDGPQRSQTRQTSFACSPLHLSPLSSLRRHCNGSALRIGGSRRAAASTMMNSVSPPPPTLPSGGASFFRGYTKLCKGLAVILLLVHLLVQLFPSAVNYLALIPARTIPFAWNLITAGYVEQTIPGVIISIIGLLLFGKLLEPLWGTKELSKFVFIVNFSTSMCVFVTAIALYYVTQQETYLYTPLSGFYGVLSGLLVGIKQLMPDQELNLFVLKIKGKWIPSLIALISVVVSFFVNDLVSSLPVILFGIYMSWIYLRYFQKRLETGLKGDPSDEFSFSSFFPGFLRPVLDPIASIFHRLLCGRSDRADSRGQTLETSSLTGSDSTEANRRRERGQRALEQRLAEKLAAVRSTESTSSDASDKV